MRYWYISNVVVAHRHCIDTGGLIYGGKVSVTHGNVDCQRWDIQHPHVHKYTDPSRFPDASLADASNYCRAPDGRDIPWCYTTSAEQRWDYCDFEAIYWGMKPNKWFIIMISKNVETHTVHVIVSWPNPTQWQMGHISDLVMLIRQSTRIFTIVIRGKLKTRSPIHWLKDNWHNLRQTLDRMYLTSISKVQYFQIRLHNDDNGVVWCVNKRIRPLDHNALDFLRTP